MPIKQSKEGRIATINIDCPPVNAIDSNNWLNLFHIINDLSEDKSVNVIVITASGKGFCGGADKSETRDEIESIPILMDHLWKAARAIHMCNVPLISACHGYVLGAGAFIPASGDFIVATKDAYFGFPGINFKVVVGGAHMTRLFPLNVVRRMILTGESLSADEAFKYGAINSIHDTKKDLYKEAFKLAEIIANKDRKSLVLAKKSLNSTETNDIESGFKSEQLLTMNIDKD